MFYNLRCFLARLLLGFDYIINQGKGTLLVSYRDNNGVQQYLIQEPLWNDLRSNEELTSALNRIKEVMALRLFNVLPPSRSKPAN